MNGNVVIVGGGIIGLSLGWYLARAGLTVQVVERGEAGRGASWVAGGMLAPHAESEPGEEALLPLLVEGLRRWPAFVDELEAATGMSVDYRRDGALLVALDQDDARKYRFWYEFLRELRQPVEWLSGYEVRKMEPYLSRSAVAAIWSPHDYHVNNQLVVLALKQAFTQAGGRLREHTPVEKVIVEGERVRGVLAGGERLEADIVVVAAGAWSSQLAGLPEDVCPPVRPVKGQVVILQMPAVEPVLQRVVWCVDAYLVPRSNGHLLVGATVEEVGFDPHLTAGGIYHLLRRAWELLPAVYELPIVEMLVGFRPTSRDDAPILGPTGVEGLVFATGHHRNGILLAPITAQTVSHYILSGELPDEIRPFTLDRFRR
ncbi:MAG: glycine oxidase ThiO [Ardenticatenia bacterium]|nr:glycine oxidase ThiO [Ardenticatenia bacterium]